MKLENIACEIIDAYKNLVQLLRGEVFITFDVAPAYCTSVMEKFDVVTYGNFATHLNTFQQTNRAEKGVIIF